MSEPRPDDDLTASGTTPPAESDASSDADAGTTQSASEIVAADMAAIDATPPSDAAVAPAVTPTPDLAPPMAAYTPPPEPPPMSAYTPPPAPPATDWAATTPTPAQPTTDWAAPAAASPTPPGGTPGQSVPETQAWAQAPAPAYQPPPAYPPQPQPQPGWPQQPPAYQQPQPYPPQQPYQQPAAYPPQQAWQQPGQPTGWVQPQGEYWAQGGGPGVWAYKTKVLAIIASLWLLLTGLIATLGGAAAFAVGSGRLTTFLRDNGATQANIDALVGAVSVLGVFFLVCGILLLLSALGIWFHKSWARVIGIIFSVLGLLISLPFLAAGSMTSTLSDGRIATTNLSPIGVVFVVLWGLTLLFLIISGGHFHKERVG